LLVRLFAASLWKNPNIFLKAQGGFSFFFLPLSSFPKKAEKTYPPQSLSSLVLPSGIEGLGGIGGAKKISIYFSSSK